MGTRGIATRRAATRPNRTKENIYIYISFNINLIKIWERVALPRVALEAL